MVDINNIRGNSNAVKARKKQEAEAAQPEKKLSKVVKGPVRTQKKSGISKFADAFISEDASTVKSTLITDIIIPGVQDLLSTILKNAVDIIFHGSSAGKYTSYDRFGKSSYISYDKFLKKESRPVARTRTGYQYDNVVLATRGEAEEVLAQLDGALDQYEMVSVADLYDLVGEPHNYTDNKYGWTDLRGADIVRARGGGYIIKLPKAEPLNN